MMSMRKSGFTLIELLTVIGIIIVIMGLLIPTIGSAMNKAHISATKAILEKLEMAVRNYEAAFGVYPTDLSYYYLGQKRFSRTFGSVMPVLEYEKKFTIDPDTGNGTDTDRLYVDAWGNTFLYFFIGIGAYDLNAAALYNAGFRAYMESAGLLYMLEDEGPDPADDSDNKLRQGFLIWSCGPDMANGSGTPGDEGGADNIGNWGFTRSKMT